MEILILPTAQNAATLAATLIAERLKKKPNLVLGCATGRTMERIYQTLVSLHQREGLDFSACHTFNLDEYVGLEATDERSYHHYMNEQLFKHVNINLANTHLPDGTATDLKAEAARYEAAIANLGGIDLQLLGLGETGHIGFNEPLSALMSRTRDKALAPLTLQQNAQFFGGADHVPKRALTMGVGTILEAKEILMVVTGKAKAEILARATEGPITAMISATALQLHPNCKVIVDEDAAAYLQGKDYYCWIFENEPEWQGISQKLFGNSTT
jgi:glucosamine-6-phosphate deaminase